MQNLYIISCQHFCKIGVANDVQLRLSQLATGNPFPMEVLAVFEYKNAVTVEKALHQKFSSVRVKGEWFSLTENQAEEAKNICRLLGGVDVTANILPTLPTEDEISETEDIFDTSEIARWDYAAMFSDGWRMERSTSKGVNGRYWCWRKGMNDDRKYIYGGLVEQLPHDIETMRRIYRDGEKK